MNSAVILGASGLTGNALVLELARRYPDATIYPLGRRILPHWVKIPNVRPIVMPKLDLVDDYKDMLQVDALFSCLGTTRARAGSAANFRKLDLEIPVQILDAAKAMGVEHVILQSAAGANPDSGNLYLRTKGELETHLQSLDFDRTDILRPSLLLGDRQEPRPMEWLARTVLGPLSAWIPPRWRPISANHVATIMADLFAHEQAHHQIFENTDLHTYSIRS